MSLFNQVKEKVTQYIDVYIKLLKIGFVEGTANILSYLMYMTICLFIFFCIILFLGFGIVEGLMAIGLTKLSSFFITIGIYLLSLFLIVMLRKQITSFFSSGVIKAMTAKSSKEDDES